MNIRFEERDAFFVSGYAVETEASSNDKELSLLWNEYKDKLISIPESKSCLYGVMWYTENHKYFYLLGIETHEKKPLGDGATFVEIPAAYFGVATVPDNMTEVEAWTDYFEKELPALGFVPDAEHGRYFEFYNKDGACELWTPVVKSGV